jgi:hypothetical protein
MENKYKSLYKILIEMIKWTKQVQKEEIRKRGYYFSKLSYAKEISTIKFCLPRGSGYTTFAQELF